MEVGCGDRKRKGYIGMDIVLLAGVGVVPDMNKIPWPFAQSEFDEIYFDDVLEHSNNFLEIIEEIYRVSKNSCIIKISVPHYSSDNMCTDPTHTTFFSSRSFNYFVRYLRFI